MSTKREMYEEVRWLLPGVAERRRYGMSSAKLIRHCLLGEPLDETWSRPLDEWDFERVLRTASTAPAHLRERADAVVAQFEIWLQESNPGHAARARSRFEQRVAS